MLMKNVPPAQKLREELEELLSLGSRKQENLPEALIGKSVRMVIQKVLEQ